MKEFKTFSQISQHQLRQQMSPVWPELILEITTLLHNPHHGCQWHIHTLLYMQGAPRISQESAQMTPLESFLIHAQAEQPLPSHTKEVNSRKATFIVLIIYLHI